MAEAGFVPYGGYWSTPFARWQKSLAGLHSLKLAAHVARNELARREISADVFDYGVLGTTVPQQGSFYGLPWLTGLIGAEGVGGPTISQACATSARCLQAATQEIADDAASCALVVTADRTSNGPHIYYPDPDGPGGTGAQENWVLDNFAGDPFAGVAMVETAENAAGRYQIDTAQQHEVVLQRHQQYQSAVEHGFHDRFMTLPFAVPDSRFRKTTTTLAGDEGIQPTSKDKLAALRPIKDGGSVTFGGQTHPADGNAGMIVTTKAKAQTLSKRPEIEISLRGFGLARVEKAHMPLAPVPAARRALAQADIGIDDLAAVKTHNPFAVNDLVFSAETGYPLENMNNNGCSLIWGHPQAPTGLRTIIELIEELVDLGGGNGLFTGCAAGDTAMAVVVRVDGA